MERHISLLLELRCKNGHAEVQAPLLLRLYGQLKGS